MNEAELIDQYIDALRRDPRAAPPPGLDANTAAFVRALVESQRDKAPSREIQARVWHRALLLADPQRQPPLDLKSSRRGHIEQHVTIVKPSTRKDAHEEDDMNRNEFLPLARIAPRTGPPISRYFLQYTLTIAAAVALIVLVGAALIDMISDPINGWPALVEQTEEPTMPELAVIAPENIDQLQQVQILGHGTITDLAWSGDTLALGSTAGVIWLYDLDNLYGTPRLLPGHRITTLFLEFDAEGKTLASIGLDNQVRLWDVASGAERAIFDSHRVDRLAFSRDGQRLAASLRTSIWVWDAVSGEDIVTLESRGVTALAFSPDATQLIVGKDDGKVEVWDIENGALLAALAGHEDRVHDSAFSPGGEMFATGSRDGMVQLWDWNEITGALNVEMQGHEQSVSRVAFSSDGRALASADFSGVIRLWDTETGAEQAVLSGHTDRVAGIAFSTDGKSLASVSVDQTLRLWDVGAGVETARVPISRGHERQAWHIAFSPDGTTLASGGAEGAIWLWDVRSGAQIRLLEGHTRDVSAEDFSPDGTTLISGALDTTVRLWDAATGEQLALLEGHNGTVTWVDYAPVPNLAVSTSSDSTARLWDLTTGEARVLDHGRGTVWSAVFSPDGKTVVTTADDGELRLWDVATGAVRVLPRGWRNGVWGAWFSPDGKEVMGGGRGDHTIWVSDVGTGTTRQMPAEGFYAGTVGAVFSANGALLGASGATSGSSPSISPALWFWDFINGQQLQVLPSSVEIAGLAFNPDGTLLAGAGADGTIRLWGVPNNP